MLSVAFAFHFCCPVDAPSQVAADVCLTSTTRDNGEYSRLGGVDINMHRAFFVVRGNSRS